MARHQLDLLLAGVLALPLRIPVVLDGLAAEHGPNNNKHINTINRNNTNNTSTNSNTNTILIRIIVTIVIVLVLILLIAITIGPLAELHRDVVMDPHRDLGRDPKVL